MLDICKASAGSGKTFALTLEYFKIIFAAPSEYRNILAVTFTNKATEEMKSRIINELHRLAEGQPSDYGVKLRETLGMDADSLRNRASLLRTLLLHDYGRLSVTTIDRFFQRIIKAFTRELGIFPAYNVELDSSLVLTEAVGRVMQSVRSKPDLKNWIKDLMSASVEEGKSWGVKAKMEDLGAELFRENYMLMDKRVQDKFSDRRFLQDYRHFLHDTVARYETALAALAASALELIRGEGLDLGDFKGGVRGCASWFYKLAGGCFDSPTATVRKGVEDDGAWFTSKSPARERIERILPRLTDLLRQALDYHDAYITRYLSADQLSGNLYQLGILNDLYQEVRAYCHDAGVMLLSDTTHILNLLIAGNDTSFLFEKCGNYYKHLMIDEFQDTSSMQWNNFRPLVTNSLAEGGKALIVGDVKQSIYRWRNGDWQLLARDVEEQFRHLGVSTRTLSDNWRSAPEIVRFNNDFFTAATITLATLYACDAGEHDTRAPIIAEAYRSLRQTPRRERAGYVDILFGPEKSEQDAPQTILRDTVAIIRDILRRGGKQRDIVILVRGGKEGAAVADHLMEYNKTADTPVDFISNDSLYVASSPYIQFIVAVLRYLAEPFDPVNRATIRYFHQAFVSSLDNLPLHALFRSVAEEEVFTLLPQLPGAEEEFTTSCSLYETVEAVIRRFSLHDKPEEVPYLIAFQDIVYEYESSRSNNIPLFLQWWEQEQDKRLLATSEDADAVRILTIHKSKGLEFEHVILPFCSWELDKTQPLRRIWCSNREKGFDALEYAPLNYTSRLADTVFRDDYLDEHLKAYIDNLNLLYVALTRAKSELYIRPFMPRAKKDGSIALSDIGAFLFLVLHDMGATLEDGNRYRLGTPLPVPPRPAPPASTVTLPAYPVWHPGDRLSVRYRYRDYSPSVPGTLSAIDEGKLLHEIFKSIRTPADLPHVLRRAALDGLLPSADLPRRHAEIAAYLATPAAAPWFHPSATLITERDILFPGGAKARPDRVVLSGGKAYVIDYKFGQSEEPRYLRQVANYCAALRRMGYPRVEGYVWYVRLGKIIPV